MVRLDMSEYQERHSVSRLIGAPPGYIGYDEGGQLTEAVRRRPYSVVLLDEIEKAHPDVFNTLLQLLDDGRLTDSQGRTVNFKNTIVVMTSNIGSQYLLGEAYNEEAAVQALHRHFRPEFLNRVDDVIPFKPIGKAELAQIVEIQAQQVRRLLAERQMSLVLTEAAKLFISGAGYDPAFGARPLKRALQRLVVDPLAMAILAGEFVDGDQIVVDVDGAGLRFGKGVRE